MSSNKPGNAREQWEANRADLETRRINDALSAQERARGVQNLNDRSESDGRGEAAKTVYEK